MVKKNGKIWKTISVVVALALIVGLLPTGFLGLTEKVEAAIQDDSGSITVFTENFENSDTTYYEGVAQSYSKLSDSDITPMNTYEDEDGNTVSGSGGSWALRTSSKTYVTAALTDEWDGDGDDDGKSLKLTSTSTSTSGDTSYYTYLTRISSDFLTDVAKERLKNGTSSALDTITLSYDFKTVSTATSSTAAYHTVYSGLFGYGTTMWSSTTAVATATGYSLYGGTATAYGRAIYLIPTAWYKASTDSTLTDAIETTASGEQYVRSSFGLDQYSTNAYYDSVTYDSSTGEITAEGTYETTGTLKYIDGYYYVGVNLCYATKYATTYIDNITVTYTYQNAENMYSDLEESGEWQNIITPYTEDAIEEAYNEGTIKSTVYSSDVDDALLSAGCTDYSTGSFETSGDWTMIYDNWSTSSMSDTYEAWSKTSWYVNSSGSYMAHWGNTPAANSTLYFLTTVDEMFAGDYETNARMYSYSASTEYSTVWVVAKLDIDSETGLGDGQYKLTPEGYSILGKVENAGSYSSSALTQKYGSYDAYKNGNLMFSLQNDYSNVQFGYYVVSNGTSSSWGCIDDCYLIGYREADVNKLVSVETLDDISIGKGFTSAQVLALLPETIEVTMTDPDYTETWTEERDLTWDLSSVKRSTVGSYTATYSYESENGAVQSGSITVTVEYWDVASTSDVEGATVYVGATIKDIMAALPTHTIDVTTSYGDKTQEETGLALTWDLSAVDKSEAGDYVATYTYTSAYAGTQTGTVTISVTDISSDRAYISGVETGETGPVEIEWNDNGYTDGTFEVIPLKTMTLTTRTISAAAFVSTSASNAYTNSEYAHTGDNSAKLVLWEDGNNDGKLILFYAYSGTALYTDSSYYSTKSDAYDQTELEPYDGTWTQETLTFTSTTTTGSFSYLSIGGTYGGGRILSYLLLTKGTEYTMTFWHTGYIVGEDGYYYVYVDDVSITYEGDATTTLYYDYAGTYAVDTVTVEAAEVNDVDTEVPEYVTADLVIEDNDYIKEGDEDYTTTQKLAVKWDDDSLVPVNEAIENNEPGVFTITGTVVYDGEEIAVETTVTICVDYYALVSESKVYGATVATGTSLEDVEAALTADIDVVSTSGGDTPSETIELTWDLSEVDTDTAGEYTATYTYKSMYIGLQTGTVTVKVTDISSDKASIEDVGTGVIGTAYVELADGYTNGTFENTNLTSGIATLMSNKISAMYTNNTNNTQRSKSYANNGSYSGRVTVKSGTSTLYYIAYTSNSTPTSTNSAWNTLTLTDGDTDFTHQTFTFTPTANPMFLHFYAGSGYLSCIMYGLDENTEYTVSFYYTGAISGYVYIDDVEITYQKEETTTLYYDYAGTYTVDNGTTVDEGEKVDISTIVPIYVTADLVLEDNAYVSADTEDYDYTTTQNLPVTWDADSIAAVNKNMPGEYTITGTATYAGEEIAVTALVTVAEAHQYEADVTEPTCTEGGYTTYTCVYCGDLYVDDYTDALGHSYADVVTPATLYSDGTIASTCSVCNDVESTVAIPKIASVSLSGTSFTYTGSAVEPDVTVTDIEGNVVSSEYYTVTYSGNTAAGAATVTVTFTGNYSGTVTESFTITATDDNNADDTDTDDGGTTVIVTSDDSGSSSDSDTGSSSGSISPKTGDVVSVFTLELILLLALAAMIMSVKKTRKALKELL